MPRIRSCLRKFGYVYYRCESNYGQAPTRKPGAGCKKRASVGGPVKSDQQHAEKIARFVSAASRFVPEASCLTQALAGESLRRESDIEPSLHIGVKKDTDESIEAHAWLELGEIKLIGGPASSEFSRFKFDMPNVPKR